VASGLVVLVLTVLGALPFLLGIPVTRADTFSLVLSFVTVALLDENLFRGAIQSRLEAVLAGAWPWLITGLLFGLWYAPGILVMAGPGAGGNVVDALLRLLAQLSLGWLLSVTRSRTGSLLPGLIAHFLFLQIGPLLALLLGR
jgi:membrane protease YdiL (CAAX protease family)